MATEFKELADSLGNPNPFKNLEDLVVGLNKILAQAVDDKKIFPYRLVTKDIIQVFQNLVNALDDAKKQQKPVELALPIDNHKVFFNLQNGNVGRFQRSIQGIVPSLQAYENDFKQIEDEANKRIQLYPSEHDLFKEYFPLGMGTIIIPERAGNLVFHNVTMRIQKRQLTSEKEGIMHRDYDDALSTIDKKLMQSIGFAFQAEDFPFEATALHVAANKYAAMYIEKHGKH